MNETDIAKAIRDGELPSGSKFANAFYHDIRISGSGVAERKSLGETAYRPPEIWCSQSMVDRANGLSVILMHPDKKLLNGEEFANRVIGTIVLPFSRDGDLRGIARVYDESVSNAMASGKFSTSPGAAFDPGANTEIQGDDCILLIEGNPTLLDHVAVVPNSGDAGGGVWDRGGPGTGIRTDSTQETAKVTEKTEERTEGDKPDSHEKKMDEIMKALGGIADMCSSLGKRLDAVEKIRADNGPVESKPMEAETVDAKKDAENERRALVDAQVKADGAFMQHGIQAPKPMAGETAIAYRLRTLGMLQDHSAVWRNVKLDTLARADTVAFANAETAIYADAERAAKNPPTQPGVLIMRTRREPTGHIVNEFHGDISTWMAPPFQYRAKIKSLREIRGAE